MERKENGMLADAPRQNGGKMGCGGGGVLAGRQLASVYAPNQEWRMIYPVEKALSHGTLFEELYKPLEASENG